MKMNVKNAWKAGHQMARMSKVTGIQFSSDMLSHIDFTADALYAFECGFLFGYYGK